LASDSIFSVEPSDASPSTRRTPELHAGHAATSVSTAHTRDGSASIVACAS
jgi:hypothetical protein